MTAAKRESESVGFGIPTLADEVRVLYSQGLTIAQAIEVVGKKYELRNEAIAKLRDVFHLPDPNAKRDSGHELPTSNPVLRGDKQCPHGHTARRKCQTCDRDDDQAEIKRLRALLMVSYDRLDVGTPDALKTAILQAVCPAGSITEADLKWAGVTLETEVTHGD